MTPAADSPDPPPAKGAPPSGGGAPMAGSPPAGVTAGRPPEAAPGHGGKHAPPGGQLPPPPAISLRRQFARTWRHGCRFLFRSQPRLTAFYMAMFLLSTLTMMIVPQLFGEITNALQRSAVATSAETTAAALPPAGEVADAATRQPRPAPSGPPSRSQLVWLFVAWAAFLLLARPLISLVLQVAVVRLDNRMGLDLGRRLFRTVLSRPLPFFHQRDIGSLTFLLRDMSIQAQMAIRQLTLDPILMGASLLAGLGFVIYNYLNLSGGEATTGSWLVVAGLLVLGLAAPFLVSRLAPGLQMASRDLRDRQAALAALLQGALQSPEEVQSFNAVPHFSDKHAEALRQLNRTREQQTVQVEKVNYFNTVPSDLTQVLLVGAAILIVFASSGVDRIGSLVAILLLVPQLMRPIQGLSSVIVSLKSAWPSIEPVLDLIESAEVEVAPASESEDASLPTVGEPAPGNAPSISGHDIHFRYRRDLPPVLEGASFHIPAGSIASVAARMGQGKTTLFRLLLRFYEPQQGHLEIGGRPIREIEPRALRRRVALLSQFPAFTHDTVRENLRLAAPEADDSSLLETCRATGLLDILKRKLDESNGDHGDGGRAGDSSGDSSGDSAVLEAPFASGSTLSGGQRRLFALTRCLLRDPEVLLLDEPTTGLDNAEKAQLIPVLRRLCTGKTVIIVDHDIRWIHRVCDHFVILEDGRTTDFEDRDRVLEDCPLFALLHRDPEAAGGDVAASDT